MTKGVEPIGALAAGESGYKVFDTVVFRSVFEPSVMKGRTLYKPAAVGVKSMRKKEEPSALWRGGTMPFLALLLLLLSLLALLP